MNKRIRNLFLLAIILSALLTSCHIPKETTKKDVTTERGFYRKYSEKLGVKFEGNEDRKLIAAVTEWIGVPYKYGGCGKSGTDCSGFVNTIYKETYNYSLNRSAFDLLKDVEQIKRKDLKCGDLVFFITSGKKISHVGIYLNDSKFIHASSSRGVIVSDLNENYYAKAYSTAGRLKARTH